VHQLRTSELRIKLIRGTQKETDIKIPEHWQVIHLGSQHQVQETFEESEVIIARNGYSTLMDLATFPKPALLIPTPGQPEQEYLAKIPVHLEMYAIQKQRKLDVLDGLNEAKAKFLNQHNPDFKPDWEKLFSIF
jgi:predicted glycosyltransferase